MGTPGTHRMRFVCDICNARVGEDEDYCEVCAQKLAVTRTLR